MSATGGMTGRGVIRLGSRLLIAVRGARAACSRRATPLLGDTTCRGGIELEIAKADTRAKQHELPISLECSRQLRGFTRVHKLSEGGAVFFSPPIFPDPDVGAGAVLISHCNDWRTRQDLNLWPLPSEGNDRYLIVKKK